MIMEIFAVFVPGWEVLRQSTLRKETLDSIAAWEAKNKASSSEAKSLNSGSTAIDSLLSGFSGFKSTKGSVKSSSGESVMTMGALEHVLERNPTPLQEFSALRDFSGENIAFLTSVAEWKNSVPKTDDGASSKELVRERFNRALRIYADFISPTHAEFPINISSQDLKNLRAIFEDAARIMYGDRREADTATPFDGFDFDNPPTSPTYSNNSSEKTLHVSVGNVADRVQYFGSVPETFDETVFDAAEKSIKYLVLTNTWPKFVKDRRTSIDSSISLGSTLA